MANQLATRSIYLGILEKNPEHFSFLTYGKTQTGIAIENPTNKPVPDSVLVASASMLMMYNQSMPQT